MLSSDWRGPQLVDIGFWVFFVQHGHARDHEKTGPKSARIQKHFVFCGENAMSGIDVLFVIISKEQSRKARDLPGLIFLSFEIRGRLRD